MVVDGAGRGGIAIAGRARLVHRTDAQAAGTRLARSFQAHRHGGSAAACAGAAGPDHTAVRRADLPRCDLALRGAHVVHASRPVAVAYPQIRAPQCLPQPWRFLPGDLDSARAGAGALGAVHTTPGTRLAGLGAIDAAVAGGAGDHVVDQFSASSARSTFERRATALSARAGAPHLAIFRRYRHRRRTLAAARKLSELTQRAERDPHLAHIYRHGVAGHSGGV